MSSDNYLISIPAKGNKIALYLVSASDPHINLEGPPHVYCNYIAKYCAESQLGQYANEELLSLDVKKLQFDPCLQIEYGPVYRHTVEKIPLEVTPGIVTIAATAGYGSVGNEQAVCFFFDPDNRGYVVATGVDEHGVPNLTLSEDGEPCDNMTEVKFPTFKGWSVHAVTGGKSVSVALTKNN